MFSAGCARTVAAAAWLVAVLWTVGRAADTTAPELAQALQHKYDGIKDFSADFVHTYEGGVLRKQITERGHLLEIGGEVFDTVVFVLQRLGELGCGGVGSTADRP